MYNCHGAGFMFMIKSIDNGIRAVDLSNNSITNVTSVSSDMLICKGRTCTMLDKIL